MILRVIVAKKTLDAYRKYPEYEDAPENKRKKY
jgi:hypothetical protein